MENILCDTGSSLPDVCRFFCTDNSGRILDFFSEPRLADERGSFVDPCREKCAGSDGPADHTHAVYMLATGAAAAAAKQRRHLGQIREHPYQRAGALS